MRKAAIILLTLASACTAAAYFVSFRAAPERSSHGRYLHYHQFPAGDWPYREISWNRHGAKTILAIQSGRFWFARYTGTTASLPFREVRLGGFIVRESTTEPWEPRWNESTIQLCHQVRIPLWLPFALFIALPARALFRRLIRWQHRNAGLCVRCKYDLTGNVSGVCPECGTAVKGT